MLKKRFEQLLFSLRWLLASIYLGLSLALLPGYLNKVIFASHRDH